MSSSPPPPPPGRRSLSMAACLKMLIRLPSFSSFFCTFHAFPSPFPYPPTSQKKVLLKPVTYLAKLKLY